MGDMEKYKHLFKTDNPKQMIVYYIFIRDEIFPLIEKLIKPYLEK